MLRLFQLVRGDPVLVHRPPRVGDVGNHEWNEKRYIGHHSQREIAGGTVPDGEGTLEVRAGRIIGRVVEPGHEEDGITDRYNDGLVWFNASKDGKTLYAVYALPDGENLPAELTWTGNLPKGKVTVLNNGKKVKAAVKDGQVTVKLPKGLVNEPIALKFSL